MPPAVQKALVAGIVICVVLGLATVFLIMSKIPSKDPDMLGRRDAYMMAFNDSGAAKKEVTFEVMKLNDDEDPITYTVYFYDHDRYYKYVIDAEAGKIAKKEILEGGGPRYSDKEGTTEDIDLD
jgi:hypothetical protein